MTQVVPREIPEADADLLMVGRVVVRDSTIGVEAAIREAAAAKRAWLAAAEFARDLNRCTATVRKTGRRCTKPARGGLGACLHHGRIAAELKRPAPPKEQPIRHARPSAEERARRAKDAAEEEARHEALYHDTYDFDLDLAFAQAQWRARAERLA